MGCLIPLAFFRIGRIIDSCLRKNVIGQTLSFHGRTEGEQARSLNPEPRGYDAHSLIMSFEGKTRHMREIILRAISCAVLS